MRKLLIFFVMALLLTASASAAWYPRSENYSTSGWIVATSGADIGGPLYVDGAVVAPAGITGTASRIAVGTFIDTSYGLKNSTSNKAQVNLSANMGLRFGTGNSTLGSLEIYPGDGIDVGASGIAVDATDIVDHAHGIDETTTNNIGVNLSADKGLEFGTGAALGSLQVEAGDGIDLGSSGVAVDVTDIIALDEGLYEKATNNIAINLTEDGGLGFGLGADSGALIIYPSSGMKTTSNGLEVNLSATSGLAIGTGAEDGALKIGVGVFEMDIIGGGNPGNFTLTGAANGDELIGVTFFDKGSVNLTSVQDLTSQFSIPADNILNQTLGGATNTSAGYMQVIWMDRTA